MITIVYFAWVKERLGVSEEIYEVPEAVNTVSDIIAALKDRGDAYSEVFSDVEKLRFALDQDFVKPGALIGTAQELAIFPPVTGG